MSGATENGVLPSAAIVAATVIGAGCSVAYRPYLRRYAALPTSGLAMSAVVVFLALLCFGSREPLFPALTGIEWAFVVFTGLASGLGYYCWLWALGKVDASRVVAFQALGPVTASAIELVGGRHLPSPALCLSIVLVVAGLLLVQPSAAPFLMTQPQ